MKDRFDNGANQSYKDYQDQISFRHFWEDSLKGLKINGEPVKPSQEPLQNPIVDSSPEKIKKMVLSNKEALKKLEMIVSELEKTADRQRERFDKNKGV